MKLITSFSRLRLTRRVARYNGALERRSAEEILAWACQTWPKSVASSSFQTQSLPLLHMIARVCPQLPVLFIDTGFHFPETLAFRDELAARLGLHVVVVRPAITPEQLEARYGERLSLRDPDLCCHIHKVEPMQRALAGFQAWIAGVRHNQTPLRSSLKVLEARPTGLVKVHPLLGWTKREVWAYLHQHNLPSHPLFAHRYCSLGCAPCTRPVLAGEGERAGRWAGTGKTECGLHAGWTAQTNRRAA